MSATAPLFGTLPPAIILIAAGILCTILPRQVRPFIAVAAPLAAYAQFFSLPMGYAALLELPGFPAVTLAELSPYSSFIAEPLLIAAIVVAIYNWHERAGLPVAAGLLYMGCTIGAVMAGDIAAFFVFWEIATIGAAFLVWSGGTERSLGAGMRFAVINILSGVLLLEAFLLHYKAEHTIAFFTADLATPSGMYLMAALAIKGAFPVVHAWLTDAYPESTPGGTVTLSVFSVTGALYALLMFFPGEPLLVTIGAIMIAFPILLALLANDLRRTLCYGLISQLGLVVTAIGVGDSTAISAALFLAVANVFGFLVMFMATGAVLFRTGTASAASLGGLAATMPLTALFAILGAIAVASVPVLASGTALLTLLVGLTEVGGPVIGAIAVFGAAGVWAHAGFKVPASAFFGDAKGTAKADEAPGHMLLAMLLAVAAFAYFGIVPLLETGFVGTLSGVIAHLSLLAFSLFIYAAARLWGLLPKDRESALIDVDWLYRRLGPAVVAGVMAVTAAAYHGWQRFIEARIKGSMARLYLAAGPSGGIARTWATGFGVLWVAILLVVMLLVSYA